MKSQRNSQNNSYLNAKTDSEKEDSTFTLILLIEKRREFNLETHIAFLDFEKAFDSVKRHTLSEILQEKNIPNLLLQNIMEIYKDNEILIKINNITTDTKSINKGVRQGCPLSRTLFNVKLFE
jgi:hypothetical protein